MEHVLSGALFAQAAPPAAGGGDMISSLMPLLLMFGVIYFILIRPQQKQAKKQKEYLASLKKGDEVVTSSGVFGKLDAVEDQVVRLEIASGVKIRLLKSQIAGPQPGAAEKPAAAEATPKKD